MTGAGWQLHLGDALDGMRQLPDASFDAVITDPPYSSGGQFRGDRVNPNVTSKYVQHGTELVRPEFGGDSRDQRSYAFWTCWWLNEAYRLCRDGAAIALFTDWRQLPTVTDALQAGGFVWRGVAVWDKVGGRPALGRIRNQAEYVVWGSKGPMATERNAPMLPGVISCSVKQDDKHHITGKPTEVMRWLVRLCERGGRILDPFAGSGTTGVAALLEGFAFVGFEREAAYHAIASRRLREAEERAPSLFAEAS